MKRSYIQILILVLAVFLLAPVATIAGDVKSPTGEYEFQARASFRSGKWKEGKKILDKGIRKYPDNSELNELMGQYFLHYQQYDRSRFYLIKATQDKSDNVHAKQMLIDVEDVTGNYSSAISYVNELLEVTPYDKGLWVRKINLYRKQGNTKLADHFLERLTKIYPNDHKLRQQFTARTEERFESSKKKGDIPDAIANIETLLKENPKNAEYYLTLCNLYLQEGRKNEALAVAERGILHTGGNASLVRKKVGILIDQRHYSEAIGYMKEYQKTHHNASIATLLKNVQDEAAYESMQNDPYIMMGKVYGRNHSMEALNFLLNNSFTREYNEDALYYINEMKKYKGSTPQLLYKEYLVNRRMGYSKKAYNLLEKVHRLQPKNMDVVAELSGYHFENADKYMMARLYEEAIPDLDWVIDNDTVKENLQAAWNKKYACLYEQGRYKEALTLLDQAGVSNFGYHKWCVRKAELLNNSGKQDEALRLLEEAMLQDRNEQHFDFYASSYEDIAVPYIKSLIANGAIKKANVEAAKLVKIRPESHEGLLYAINTSNQLHKRNDFLNYVDQALQYYPEDITFKVKKATSYNDVEDYQNALDELRPQLENYSGDSALIKAYTSTSDLLALKLISENHPGQAITVIDSALVYNMDSPELLYDKGLAYEKMHVYDSAYVYQRFNRKDAEVQLHLNELHYRNARNEVYLGYLHSRLGDNYTVKGIASFGFIHKWKWDTFGLTANYAGRDGYADNTDAENYNTGGSGIQLLAEWSHNFQSSCTLTLGGGWSNKYFPNYQGNLRLEFSLKNDWLLDIHGGYRRVEAVSRQMQADSTYIDFGTWSYNWVYKGWNKSWRNLYNAGLGIQKEMWPFILGVKGDVVILDEKYYFNASAQAKFFPIETNKFTHILASFGLGTAPESTVLDFGMPGTFSHLNTNVGLGFNWMITGNLALLLQGNWYTFYNQTNLRIGATDSFTDKVDTRYKNLFNLYLQMNIAF